MVSVTKIARLDPSEGKNVDTRTGHLILLAGITGRISAAIAVLSLLVFPLHPSVWPVVVILTTGALFGVCVQAGRLAAAGRETLGSFLLLGGMVTVLNGAGIATGAPIMHAALNTVPLVLAGMLMGRRPVLAFSGLVGLVVLLRLAALQLLPPLVVMSEAEFGNLDLVILFGVFAALALVVSDYSESLGGALEETESRARELAGANRQLAERARQLETAKAEIESKTETALGVAREIHAMARELAGASSQQAIGASQQASAMAEVAASMDELGRAAAHIAENSAHASDLATEALRAAELGRRSVELAVAGLDEIRAEMRRIAEKNLALGQKTLAVGEVIELITEIADRTHLLALNAAIESAAAGEYGRRFGVVASQVKELASEAKGAARQVRSAMVEIQQAASGTVLAAEKGETKVDAGVRLGHEAGDEIAQIVESVEEVSTAAREMLLATQQQLSASEQVVSTIREVEQVTAQSAAGSRQTSEAVSRLVAVAERLG